VIIVFAESGVSLNPEQEVWIKEHPVIRLAPDPDFAPIEFIENGVYMGMARDYLDLISERTGLNIEALNVENWDHSLILLRERRADILGAATPTTSRKKYLVFTTAVFNSNVVILGRSSNTENVELEDLNGFKVGIMSGYAEEDYLSLVMPLLDTITYTSHRKALEDLSFGRIDYFIGQLSILSYYIEQTALTNIIIAGDTGFRHQLSFAVRSDWPILRDILQIGLDSISEKEKKEIREKWIGLQLERLYIPRTVIPVIFISLGGLFLILIMILIWNRTLSRKVEQKTGELNDELEQKRLQAESLLKSNDEKIQLLHEVHHRVNNNMQMVKSLLNFEFNDQAHPPGAERMFRSISRINAIALAQEMGHKDIAVDRIDIREFTRYLIDNLLVQYGESNFIEYKFNDGNFICNLKMTINIGIVLTEVLLNLVGSGLFSETGILVQISCVDAESFTLGMHIHKENILIDMLEGLPGSSTNILILNMLEDLSATSGFSIKETGGMTEALWTLSVPIMV